MRIGAGGWLTGLDFSADGATRVVRTDTYGGYLWNGQSWQQLITAASMPPEDVGMEMNDGIYELRVAPGQSSRLYMSYRGYVYRSDDRGARWHKTSFARQPMNANDNYRMYGEKAAVDPRNADVLYVGTSGAGLFVSSTGGASWQRVAAVPAGPADSAGITGIVFAPNSGVLDGKTSVLYAAVAGSGVWRTRDAGATWATVPGSPPNVVHATAGPDGHYYATSSSAGGGAVWRLSGDTWQNITPPSNQYWHSLLVDPFDPAHIIAATDGGYLAESFNRGNTWLDIRWTVRRVANDIPWLAWTHETYLSNGDMRFDPTVRGRVWFSQGIGVWTTDLVPNATSVTWTSSSLGIEQLVANSITAPPGGRPVVASWDRPLFHVADPEVFPSEHGPTSAFSMGWDVDYASTDPSFLVSVVGWVDVQSGFSTDRGRTWTRFPTMPLGSTSSFGTFGFGVIAASTPDNIVWVPSNRRAPHYTKDRGATWRKVVLPGVPDSSDGWSGLHWAYYLTRKVVIADRVTQGTFYMMHTPAGLFRTVDGGDTWTLVKSGEIAPASGFNAKLGAVPNRAGHLFFTSGQQTSGAAPTGPFMRSTDAGATWTAVPNVLEVFAFGFGKEAPGAAYPTLFIAGYVSGEWGYWMSTDAGGQWTKLTDYPMGSLDQPTAVDGDKDVFGTVYVGFKGSGYAYATLECLP